MTGTTLFSPDQIKSIVNETIAQANIPPEHKNAVVITADNAGVGVAVRFKMGADNNWQVQGAYRHTSAGDNLVGGDVVYSW